MSKSRQIPQELMEDWLSHPVTEALLRVVLPKRLEVLRDKWEKGEFTDQSQYATAIANASAIGQCLAIRWMTELDYDTFKGELNDAEEPERPGTSG